MISSPPIWGHYLTLLSRHPTMIEQLKQYPKAIASVEEKLLKLNREIEIQNQLISFFDADIEKTISDDKTLKNDQQRKSKRLELQQQPDYLEIRRKLTELKEQRERNVIQLNQLRSEFSVMKLELRMQIANLEAAA